MVYTSPSSLATVCLCFTNQTLPLCTNLVEAELENSMFLSKIEQDCLGGTQTSDTEARQHRSTVIFSRKKMMESHPGAQNCKWNAHTESMLWYLMNYIVNRKWYFHGKFTHLLCLSLGTNKQSSDINNSGVIDKYFRGNRLTEHWGVIAPFGW